ncbi:hypothetical protein [Siphonobacter sp. SORGH_AS_0500]|uniref:hypothetical protein n=1 Tax=Siphonobacter sp. SORGH_AS_0500 TaxID=1864824 RepID=UPI00285DBC7B|nr:hypothetical protein [Siphonobacter sp. SORGH_AS_0500]MDR6196156.1 hypothetical protein [Siphonobacter sp. SORGH_AS_0500]
MTEEQKKNVAYYASLHYSENDITFLTGVERTDPEFKDLVRIEYLRREAKVRESIFRLAESGSSPAQAMALRIVETKKLSTI